MRLSVNSLSLNVEQAGAGRPLLLLHGFTGGAESWAPLIPRFIERGFRTIALDLIGHGQSDAPVDPERYRMEQCVEDLLALLDQLGIEKAVVLGYSMGGRVALHLAAAAPHRVEALVLESASPGILDTTERRARRKSDDRLAEEIERDGLEAFVDRWERLPLLALGDNVPAETHARMRVQRLRSSAIGLANSQRGMGAARQEPLTDQLTNLHVPTLLIVGERDEKYRRLGAAMAEAKRKALSPSRSTREARLPEARFVAVAGAGHAVHVDQPGPFAALVLEFLSSQTCAADRPRSPEF